MRSSCDSVVDINAFQKFLDRLGAHHRDELSGIFLLQLPELFFGQQLAFLQRSVARIDRDVGFEIKNALEFAERHVEQMPDAAGQALEEPDVGTRAGQFDMAEPFAANLRERDFDTALVADDAAVLHALVLSAQTLPVGHGTENPRAEQAVFLRLESAVIDGFRLCDFTMRPGPDLFRRSQTDPDAVKIGDRRRSVVRIRSNQCIPPIAGLRLVAREFRSYRRSRSASGLCILQPLILKGPNHYAVGFLFISSTSRHRLCSSRISTLKDSGTPGSIAASPLTIAS